MPVATSHWNVVSASTLRSFTHHFYFRYFNDLFLSSTFAANFMVVCCGIRSAVEDVCIAWRNYSATISACLWSVGTATCKKKLSWLVAALDLLTKKLFFLLGALPNNAFTYWSECSALCFLVWYLSFWAPARRKAPASRNRWWHFLSVCLSVRLQSDTYMYKTAKIFSSPQGLDRYM